jgi:glycosyltransferase involved in cell wall biosynthesis
MDQRMYIAMVTETYPPEVNGVARTVALMVQGLRRRGHEIQLVRPRQGAQDRPLVEPDYEELLRPGFRIPRYPQLRMGLPSKGALQRAWSEEAPDVVHIATEGPLGGSALAAARALGIPVATDFHTNFDAYSGHYGAGWFAGLVRAHLRRFHNRAGCTMVPTDELAAQLARHGFRRLRVVGRGVDSAVFSPAKRSAELRRSWGAGEDIPVALCVSRFAPEKNFPLVLEAYRAMRAARPETRLVLVGDGPMAAELKRALAGEMRGIVVAGRLVNGELSAHYASADIFLFPSTTETFGNVTMEAMASGLAVVACDYAAARQHIVHGRSGLLVPVDDRAGFIEQAAALARDLPRARSLGREARAAAEPLGWDRVVADFETVLLETAGAQERVLRASHAAA